MEEYQQRTVNLENIRLHSPVKGSAIPKQRHDTHSVYSFGLKYSLKLEKKILKNFPNHEYFNLDFKKLKSLLLTDNKFKDVYLRRILLNKNLKKSYSSVEKPFPLIKKISSSQAINKTDEFLTSVIKSPYHKKFLGSLERNIELRKNKKYDYKEKDTQAEFFLDKLKELNRNIKFKIKDDQNTLFGSSIKRKKNKSNTSSSLNSSAISNPSFDNKNKLDFFIISSNLNFGNRNKSKRMPVLSLEELKLEQVKAEALKLEKDIRNSIEKNDLAKKFEEIRDEKFSWDNSNKIKNQDIAAITKEGLLNFNNSSISSLYSTFKNNLNHNVNKHLYRGLNDSNMIEIKKNENITNMNTNELENQDKINNNKTNSVSKTKLKFNSNANEKFSTNSKYKNLNNPQSALNSIECFFTKSKVSNLRNTLRNSYYNNLSINEEMSKSKNYSTDNDFKNLEKKFLNEQNRSTKLNIFHTSGNQNYNDNYNSNKTISKSEWNKIDNLNEKISNYLGDCLEINNNQVIKDKCNYNNDLNKVREKSKPFKPNFEKYKFENICLNNRDKNLEKIKQYFENRKKLDNISTKLEKNIINNEVRNLKSITHNDCISSNINERN